jgi:hypothetical protein
LKSCSKPYISVGFFIDQIHIVFLLNLIELRNLEEFCNANVILLIDNYTSDMTDMILNLLQDVRVRVIPGFPHMIQIFHEFNISFWKSWSNVSNTNCHSITMNG